MNEEAKIDRALICEDIARWQAAATVDTAGAVARWVMPLLAMLDDLSARISKCEDNWVESVKALVPKREIGPIVGGHIDTDVPPGKTDGAAFSSARAEALTKEERAFFEAALRLARGCPKGCIETAGAGLERMRDFTAAYGALAQKARG